jgi:hypothetical protein
VLLEQGTKAFLELAEQGGRIAACDCAERGGAWRVGIAGEHSLDVLGAGAVADVGLVNRLGEVVERQQ